MIGSPLLARFPGILHQFGSRQAAERPEVIIAKQVHGNRVCFLVEPPAGRFDALVTDRPGLALGVQTADCLPILLYEPEAGLVAAVHAGWRGTAVRVVQKAIEEIVRRGGRAERLVAALGPAIGGGCYEVGPEVRAAYEREFPIAAGWFRPSKEGKWFFDLAEANRAQIAEAGVPAERIDTIDLCTHCRPDLFYSYRRDGPGIATGRMVSFIQIL